MNAHERAICRPDRAKRFLSRMIVTVAIALALGSGTGAAAEKAQRPPNILLFMADDLGAKHVGCYGGTEYATPNVDALAENGLRFETCWATPICSPTRAEILTGRYDVRTKWKWLVMATYQCTAMPDYLMLEKHHTSFASVLQANDYATMVTGKWMLSGTNQNVIEQMGAMGFEEHCIWPIHSCYLPESVDYRGPAQKFSRYWKPTLLDNGKLVEGGEDDYGPDMIVDSTIEFMRKHKDRPFCIHYGELLPHLPAPGTPVPGKPGEKRPGTLKGNIEYMDTIVGRLVAALDELGLRENTIIIFTGDNGTPKYGKGSKRQEHGVRVPLIVNCPGTVPEGEVTRQLVDYSDMFPTLVELTASQEMLDPEYEHDGRSFAPRLLGRPMTGREWIYGSNGMLRDERWLLDGNGKLWDCGDRRDETDYADVTDSQAPEVLSAKERFARILAELAERGK